jgi:hypothetical protein
MTNIQWIDRRMPRILRGRIFATINGAKNGCHSTQDTKMPLRTCRGGNRVLMGLLKALLSKLPIKEERNKRSIQRIR